MTRYFFHTSDGERLCDEEGTELPDLHSARLQAARLLSELVRWKAEDLWKEGRLTVDVMDEHGLLLMSVDASTVHSPAVSSARVGSPPG